MPESPRFLLEVTFVITNTQGSQRRWNKFLLTLGEYVCLFRRYIFPSYYRTMEGLVSWRHTFNNQQAKRLPHGLKALMFLLKQVVSLVEENAPYCFIKETLFLELLLHSGHPGSLCFQWDGPKPFALLHPMGSDNITWWSENRGACVFHLLAIHCHSYLLDWKTRWSLDDSEVNSRHKHESTGSAWEGLHGEYCFSVNPLCQRPRNLFRKGLVVNSPLAAPTTRFSVSHTCCFTCCMAVVRAFTSAWNGLPSSSYKMYSQWENSSKLIKNWTHSIFWKEQYFFSQNLHQNKKEWFLNPLM